jgi:hypothetical protein
LAVQVKSAALTMPAAITAAARATASTQASSPFAATSAMGPRAPPAGRPCGKRTAHGTWNSHLYLLELKHQVEKALYAIGTLKLRALH